MAEPPRPAPRRRAVALRYDQQQDHAPRVVAKGQGSIAERLMELAQEHGVPLWEDTDLVQLLGALELDSEIPPAMYAALAEILAQLYRLNRDHPGR